ncbi:MAG TPA: stage III sporulation protein AE [Candidatus Caccopulliclostridium gallistercoris]|uniref:Stage III sporulation protein AE n=1 Tax=Candidatus Caccopulliclostridium gallistercoris TaxID=2840719 RepID=A0A9D1NEK1_9FIRM|nr:stage III sporulation protein AE [Candidatus Caccopulliclostridium gallistercoris]
MKKFLIFLSIAFLIGLPLFNIGTVAYAESEEELISEIEDNVNGQLEDLDLSGLESILSNLNSQQSGIFGSTSFIEKLQSILSGEFTDNAGSVWEAILKLIFDELLNFLPLIATIIAVAILSGMVGDLRGTNSKSIADITHFVCYGVIIVLVVSACTNVLTLTSSTLQGLKEQIDIAFPILLTILTAIGGTASVGVYQPAVALFSGTIMQIFTLVLMPLFIFSLVFTVISNLSPSVKLEKFSNFFNSLFKWITGAVFTIFIGFLIIQGITAGSLDTVSIRTAKYAIRSYIPILGGYLSEGFNVIMASSILIKNAIGASGLLLMFSSVIVPVVEIVLLMLCLKLTAGILEPLTDSRISNFINGVAKSLIMPIVLIIGVAFMYLIFMGLIISTGNFI